jgi:acyl-coenzyme A thioesterase PaaI-like protein
METTETRINIADDHYCFGCGRLNPFGLHMHFYALDSNSIWAPFTPLREHEGYMGMTHGGIITTVLDEVMAWSLYRIGAWAVTARLSVAFKHPIEVGVPARAIGRVVADRGRLLDVSGTIERAHDGLVLAESTAVFARVPKSQADAWRDRYSPA